MLKVVNQKFTFIGDGNELLDDFITVLHSFLLTTTTRMEIPKEEAIKEVEKVVNLVCKEFMEEE